MVVMLVPVIVIIVIIVIVVMMVAGTLGIVAFIVIIVVVVMVMMVMLLPCGCRKTCQLVLNRVAALHCRQKLLAVQLTPRRGDNDSRRAMLLQHRDRLFEFRLAYPLGV